MESHYAIEYVVCSPVWGVVAKRESLIAENRGEARQKFDTWKKDHPEAREPHLQETRTID